LQPISRCLRKGNTNEKTKEIKEASPRIKGKEAGAIQTNIFQIIVKEG